LYYHRAAVQKRNFYTVLLLKIDCVLISKKKKASTYE
jgi:hypothetical protein